MHCRENWRVKRCLCCCCCCCWWWWWWWWCCSCCCCCCCCGWCCHDTYLWGQSMPVKVLRHLFEQIILCCFHSTKALLGASVATDSCPTYYLVFGSWIKGVFPRSAVSVGKRTVLVLQVQSTTLRPFAFQTCYVSTMVSTHESSALS